MDTDGRRFRPMVLLLLFFLAFSINGCNIWSNDSTSFSFLPAPEPSPPPEEPPPPDEPPPPEEPPPPVPTPATFLIDTGGGAGSAGDGGQGYYDSGIYLENYGPLGIRIRKEGEADASFTPTVPSVTADLGAEPLTVGRDMNIPVLESPPAGDNVYFFLGGDTALYHRVDDITTVQVTGIRVDAGATLTLGLNYDWNGNGLYETAMVSLENDLEILGTLRTAAFEDAGTQESGYPLDHGAFSINTGGGVLVRTTGTVSTAGDNSTTGRGGHGGFLNVESSAGSANGGIFLNLGVIDASGGTTTDPGSEGGNAAHYGGSWYGIYLYCDNDFISTGTLRANGGNGGTNGGSGPGGYGVFVNGALSVMNTGTVSFNGGIGTGGNGGDTGRFEMVAGNGSILNSGAISVKGGSGKENGGSGGEVSLSLESDGDILNSGDVNTSGGESTGTNGAVSGGSAAGIYLYGNGGRLISSGNLTASGGNAASDDPSSSGGEANMIDIELFGGSAPAGAMAISGNLVAKGGSGANGGSGGDVYLYYSDSGGSGGIVLLGFTDIIGSGGNAARNGGECAGVYIYDYSGGVMPMKVAGKARAAAAEEGTTGILNEADITASGGSNLSDETGYAGSGGSVELQSDSAAVASSGAITADGGNGVKYAGSGGSIYLSTNNATDNGAVAASGPISADGGDSAATDSGSGAYAGSGGYVYLYSPTTPSTYASISVLPGSGGDPDNPASVGSIEIDGADVTPPDGTLP